jgi:TadE-like protein
MLPMPGRGQRLALHRWGLHRRRAADAYASGQSMVEFALVLPILLVILLGVADFGRVFAAGITMEAAARDGGEVVALERLHNPPTTLGDPTYYQALHDLAARTVCHEAKLLPNTTYDPGAPGATPPVPEACPDIPVVAVCVHDDADPLCSAADAVSGHSGAVPPECAGILDTTNRSNASGGETISKFVEVRVCYHFTTLFNLRLQLPMATGMNLGDVWLERARTFVIDCPPQAVATC